MKEELYKYLSIGLLALLLLVCFGSLITYFVVGQESINVAYALTNNGYIADNILPFSDSTAFQGVSVNINDSTYTDSVSS